MNRAVLILTLAAAVLIAGTGIANARTTSCGNIGSIRLGDVGEGGAWKILATRVSCRRARIVARACVRDQLRGWRIYSEERDDRDYDYSRTILESGEARVSFEVLGGGGCYGP